MYVCRFAILLDTDNVFEEFMIAENLSLFQNLNNMPEGLLVFRPFVLQ